MTRPTVLDLFAGYGGFSLAFDLAGFRTIAFSEIDPYASAVLAHRFPSVPNLGDVRGVTRDRVFDECGTLPTVVTGGFPCQPHSLAGKRNASADERDLWDECVRVLRDLRPEFALFENVAGLFSSERGAFFNRVLSDLAALGYACSWETLSAADVGAPHRRDRVWLLCVDERVDDAQHDGQPRPEVTGGAGTRGHASRWSERPEQLAGSSVGARGAAELADRHGNIGGAGRRQPHSGTNGRHDPRRSCAEGLAYPSSERAGGVGAGILASERRSRPALPRQPEQSGEGLADSRQQGLQGGEWRGSAGAQGAPSGHAAERDSTRRKFWPAAHGLWPARPGQPQFGWEPPRVVGDPNGGRREQRHEGVGGVSVVDAAGRADGGLADAERIGRDGGTDRIGGRQRESAEAQGLGALRDDSGQTQPQLGRDADGPAHRLDAVAAQVYQAQEGDAVNRTHRLKAIGNGIVPPCALPFALAIRRIITEATQ